MGSMHTYTGAPFYRSGSLVAVKGPKVRRIIGAVRKQQNVNVTIRKCFKTKQSQ